MKASSPRALLALVAFTRRSRVFLDFGALFRIQGSACGMWGAVSRSLRSLLLSFIITASNFPPASWCNDNDAFKQTLYFLWAKIFSFFKCVDVISCTFWRAFKFKPNLWTGLGKKVWIIWKFVMNFLAGIQFCFSFGFDLSAAVCLHHQLTPVTFILTVIWGSNLGGNFVWVFMWVLLK